MYNGAEAMLSWMPSELGSIDSDGEYQTVKSTLSVFFAFFGGLSLMQFIDRATHEKFFLRDLREESGEVEKILNASVDIHQLGRIKSENQNRIEQMDVKVIKSYINRSYSPENEKLQRYQYLIKRIDEQINKVNTLISNVIYEENKANEEKQREIEEKALVAKKNAEKARREREFINAINRSIKKNNMKAIKSLDCVESDQIYLIDMQANEAKWNALDSAASATLAINDKEIKNGCGEPIDIKMFLKECPNSLVVDGFKIMAAYSGDSHGGHTELYSESKEGKSEFLSGIKIFETVDGFIEGFFIALQLPTKGIYWHGLYGRDYKFMLNNRHFIDVLCSNMSLQAEEAVEKIAAPAGIRFVKSGDCYEVSCLAAYPNGSIVDMSISVSDGNIKIQPIKSVLDSKATILY